MVMPSLIHATLIWKRTPTVFLGRFVATFPVHNSRGDFNVTEVFAKHISAMLRLFGFGAAAPWRPLIFLTCATWCGRFVHVAVIQKARETVI